MRATRMTPLVSGLLLAACSDGPTTVTGDPGNLMFSKVGIVTITQLDLGALTGYQSAATAVNGAGQIAGYSTLSIDETRGFLWDDGTVTDLTSLGGDVTVAYGINEAGVVVGQSEDAAGTSHAFIWDDGVIKGLDIAGSIHSVANAVSDGTPARVVGNVSYEAGYPYAFVYDVGTGDLVILHKLLQDYKCSRALDVNDRNHVVGVAGTSAFFWDGGSEVTILPAFPDGVSAALSINEADQIVGVASDAYNVWHAVMWENGTMTDLGPPLKPGLPSAAYGVNDAGQAVGNSGLPPSIGCGLPGGPVIGLPGDPSAIVAFPFVVDDVPLVGLSTLADGDMASAHDINNHGTAVGWNLGGKHPVAVRWSIEFIPTTAEDATEELTLSVGDLENAGTLANGTAQSLMGKLDAVTRQLNKGHVTPALKLLDAFIREVEMLLARGDLSEADASELLAAAHEAIALLNG